MCPRTRRGDEGCCLVPNRCNFLVCRGGRVEPAFRLGQRAGPADTDTPSGLAVLLGRKIAHDRHGALGVDQHLQTHRAQQQLRETTAPAGAHHRQR